MGCTVTIRDTTTGEERVWNSDREWTGDYLWSEGNFACDCNRALAFAWAAGEDDPERECGSSRYLIVSIVSNGEVVYEEEEDATPPQS